VARDQNRLADFVAPLSAAGCRVSLFIAADPRQIDAAHRVGAEVIEIHTGAYCDAFAEGDTRTCTAELEAITQMAAYAHELGLEVHAGHGLTYDDVTPIAALPQVMEVNIGHFLIGEAVFRGFAPAIAAAWGLASALGMGALMLAHGWVFMALKIIGALYLGYLALKSLRSACTPRALQDRAPLKGGLRRVYAKSVAIHLTNPKAILAWGAIYAIALPAGAPLSAVLLLFAQLLAVSCVVFIGYGLLFSTPRIVAAYRRARRWFEGGFAVMFGAASVKISAARLCRLAQPALRMCACATPSRPTRAICPRPIAKPRKATQRVRCGCCPCFWRSLRAAARM